MEINSSLKTFAANQAAATPAAAPAAQPTASQAAPTDSVTISPEALALSALPEGSVTPMADVPGWPPKDPVRN